MEHNATTSDLIGTANLVCNLVLEILWHGDAL
jgi:hypothetical protein